MFLLNLLKRVCLCLVVVTHLIQVPVFANDTDDESEVQSASETRDIFTPSRKRKRAKFHISPASQELGYAIYLIHDSKEKFEKIDFNSDVVSSEIFHEKLRTLEDQVGLLRQSGSLHKFHRYIGLVSVNKVLSRRALNRFREHAAACNSITKSTEKRLCLGLKLNSRQNLDNNMSVLAYNIHPSQIKAIEAHFIKIFGGLEDLGWNSNAGDLGAKYKFDHSEINDDSDTEWLKSVF